MDGQKLTDFDLQFVATVLSAIRGEDDVPTIPGMSLACNAISEKGRAMLASALSRAGCNCSSSTCAATRSGARAPRALEA